MIITIGLIVWLLAIVCVLRFFTVSANNQHRKRGGKKP